MNTDLLIDAIGEIDENKIINAKLFKVKTRKKPIKRMIVIAAAIILCITVTVPVLAATVNPIYELVYKISPGLAQMMKPVQMSCEDNGIKMEVMSASVYENEAAVYLSLEDMTDQNRIDETTDLFDSYLHLNALSNLLEEVRYGAYPSSDIVVDSVLPIYDIHCELYYDDQDSYQVLQGLWKMAEKYNRRLISYGKDLCNPSISACFLENELSDLLGRNIDIAESWSKVISLLSGHKENRGYDLLSKYVLDSAPGDPLSETPQRYDNNDFYVQSYFEGPSQEAFISFMSQYTVGVENTIKDYMMPINRVE